MSRKTEITNISGFGTEIEKQAKLHAAATEKMWRGIGREPGTKVWRIQDFQVVAIPDSEFGRFYSGDSFIVLHTFKMNDKLKHNVHFWLGLETTQDEAGTAAYKTVELDDYLGGEPVQYREIQGYETDLFLGYFQHFMVSQGGVASGFKHVGPVSYQTRLYQIKGKKNNLVIRQVPLSFKSMNSGDVFLVDNGLELYQWNGSKANGQEKVKAASFARALASERKSAKITVFDEGDSDANPLWAAIGGKGPIASESEGGRDSVVDRTKCKLIRLSYSSGKLVEKLEATGNIKKSMLDSNDVFVLDSGVSIYVWIGKNANKEEKSNGLNTAIKYIVSAGLPPTTPISRVLESGENAEFNSLLIS